MCRIQSIKKCTFTVVVLIVVSLTAPVNSLKYRVRFEPTKSLTPCKNTKYPPIQDFYDFSKMDLKIASDNTLFVSGSVTFIADVVDTDVISALTTTKMKSRGRWIDTPFSMMIKDLCEIYFEEGRWWTEHITGIYVGDQRRCPPMKNLPLPLNFSLSLNLDFPTPVPTGEYMATTIFKTGKKEFCFQMNVDLEQAPK